MGSLHDAVVAARLGRGSAAPNPLVGAVIARDGVTIATGHHAQAGTLHAEAMALSLCADPVGATMYVTLEPCAHQGKQPPCADAIVASGIRHVVVGALDPNPITAGAGIAKLRENGIRVDVLNDPESRRLIEDFSVWIRSSRPYVALKMAASLNGKVTTKPGVTERLTSELWNREVMELRAEFDAAMVGSGTLRIDDSRLTVRPAFARKRPYRRIVVAGMHKIRTEHAIFTPEHGYEPTIVLVPESEAETFAPLRARADVIEVRECEGGIDMAAALDILRAKRDIYSVMCEGGPHLAASLLSSHLVDRVYWVVAPVVFAQNGAVDALSARSGRVQELRMAADRVQRFGQDVLISGRPNGVPRV